MSRVAAETGASAEGSPAASARDEGQTKAVIAQQVEPSVEAEKMPPAGEADRDKGAEAASAAVASSGATPVNPLGDALAALDRKDYATAKRLFEALGRKDAAESIENALAALDRKDYATAQGLFEALAPCKSAAPGEPMASDSQRKPGMPPVAVIPFAKAADRWPPPQAEKAKKRRLKPLLLGTGLALFAVFGASASYYGPRLNWTFGATKSQAAAGFTSAFALVKANLEAITGSKAREEQRAAIRDLSAALTQVTIRLDHVEQDYEERFDKLGERIDQNSSVRFADIGARIDELEKKAAAPAAPASTSSAPVSEYANVEARLDRLEKRAVIAAARASDNGDVEARLDRLEKRAALAGAAPAPGYADVVARLDRLEKRAAVAAASSAKPLPPDGPKQSMLTARAEPSAADPVAKPDNPGPLLRNYSIEAVQGGMAVVDGRFGLQQVGPGDFIPGAGRVLRIERRGGAWFVVTSRGVIGSGQAPDY
ncbi:MAG TPA: hypothetical protein VFE63_15550 [Roseiarcus sp.]|nr:hypothetical protein [Roseiarcus sp.]